MKNQNVYIDNKNLEEKSSDLVIQKKKIATNCIDLQCKNEHLKILIEKLNKMAYQRESLFLSAKSLEKPVREEESLYLKDLAVFNELKQAKESKTNLEETLVQLKDKIEQINKKLNK